METNNLKIKVSYIMLERHKDEPQAVINYIKTQITTGTLTTEALEIMEDEARAEGRKEGQKDASKEILNLLKQMKKEPPSSEYPEELYDIGYTTALSRAEFEIEKLIEKVG